MLGVEDAWLIELKPTFKKIAKKTKTIKQYRTSKGKSMNIPITWTS